MSHTELLESGAVRETLRVLVTQGPLFDSDVPSKAGRDKLVAAGLAAPVVIKGKAGYTAATLHGSEALKGVQS